MHEKAPLRRVINRGKDLLFVPGLESLWRRKLRGEVMALVYHRVDDPEKYDFLERGGTPVIRPEALAAELSWLRDRGMRFLTFADIRAGEFPASSECGVVVTFDDGFRDNYTTALEVLDTLGIKGVIFQCSAMIGGSEMIPEHALYWLATQPASAPALLDQACEAGWVGAAETTSGNLGEQVGRWIREVPAASLQAGVERACESYSTRELAKVLYPTAAELRRAAVAGHEIGSHGHRHLHRATLDAVTFERELSLSIAHIEAATGIAPAAFSYPFNAYFSGDREICSRHFQQALTVDGQTIRRDSDPLALSRFTWPGPARNGLRQRRWLLTGRI